MASSMRQAAKATLKYPSRISISEISQSQTTERILPRQSPVVWSSQPKYLSPKQQQQYEENGFIILRKAISPNIVNLLKDCVKSFQDMQDSDIAISEENPIVTEPGSNQIRSIFSWHKMREISPVFYNLARYEPILGAAEDIVGSKAYVHQSRINCQAGFRGKGFYWHSDSETWMAEDGMPDMRACSAVVMLDKNCEMNGSLMVIPGSHKHFVSCIGETPGRNWEKSLKYQQEVGTPDESIIADMTEKYGITYCTGDPGDVLIFDNNLLHGSHSNISPYSRTNAFIVYNSVENKLQNHEGVLVRPNHIAERSEEHTKGLDKVDSL